MYKVKEMSWVQFDRRRKETDMVILPTGATEVYGPHLPLGSDIIVAERVALILAERVNALVGPSIEVGDSLALTAFPGTLTVSPEHFKGYVADVCKSFIKWGFRRFFFLNTHLGNVVLLDQIARSLQEEYGVVCGAVDWWRFLCSLSEGIVETGALAHAHASETGTSVLLHVAPELVDMSMAPHTPPQYEDKFKDLIKYIRYDRYTDSGTIGNAKVSTAEKGRVIVERAVARMVEFIEHVVK